MPANVETMFYVGAKPWHGLGKELSDVVGWEEAMRAAELDWRVGLYPVFAHGTEGRTSEAIGRRAVVRLTNGHSVLGIVTEKYRPVQNAEAFRFMDDVADAGLMYETAGALGTGEVVWALARFPKDCMIAGDDAVRFFLLLSNSHDGSSSLRVSVTPVRVVCQNTLNAALGSAQRSWSARHVGNPTARFAEARRTLELSYKYAASFEQTMNALSSYSLTSKEFDSILSDVFPADKETGERSTQAENKASAVRQVYQQGSDLAPYRGTAWAAYNAFAAVNDHVTKYRSSERRFLRAAVEEGTIKDTSLEAIKQIVFGAKLGSKQTA